MAMQVKATLARYEELQDLIDSGMEELSSKTSKLLSAPAECSAS